ncbi:MAG: hypothetical protein JRC99_12460 [Deltaproteobacteria bacterium]|nr:hypothetical protein [Deltaproteobacteria bacterium]
MPSDLKKVIALIAVMALVFLALFLVSVQAQTPPVSTVLALPDTVRTEQIQLDFTVESSLPWEAGGGVGIYYKTSGMADWAYAGASVESPLIWTPPFINTGYVFSSTVTDNEGNNEGYEFTFEASTTYVPGGVPPGTPMLKWHWTHPTTGSEVVEYIAEWMVDGNIRMITGIAVGDTTFAFVEVPYTPGSNQTIRVRGKDAAHMVGVWSEWAEVWSDVYPGAPGTPAGMLVIKP